MTLYEKIKNAVDNKIYPALNAEIAAINKQHPGTDKFSVAARDKAVKEATTLADRASIVQMHMAICAEIEKLANKKRKKGDDDAHV